MQEYKVLKIFKGEDGVWRKPTQVVKLSDEEGTKQRRFGHVMRINNNLKTRYKMGQKYVATGNIKHNTVKYAYGDKIELTKEDAQPLLENNVIETEKGFKRLEAMKNISPTTVEELEAEIEKLKAENEGLKADLKAANDTIAVLQSQKEEKSKDEEPK
jgi:septal ring factor EnvC (AmiA/AmiB activator)